MRSETVGSLDPLVPAATSTTSTVEAVADLPSPTRTTLLASLDPDVLNDISMTSIPTDVIVPTSGISLDEQTNPINGNPDNAPILLGTPGTSGTGKDAVEVDWAGISAGTALPPTYTIPGNSWPTAAQMDNWPVILVNGDLSLSGSETNGKGILIVTGNLTMGGSWNHNGIVLVGGVLTSNGNNAIQGAVITALNIKLGINVPQNAIANGNKTFQYNSCSIASALKRIGSVQRVRNGWTDTWSSY